MKIKILRYIWMFSLLGGTLLAASCTSQQYLYRLNQLDKEGNKSGIWMELEGNPNEEQIMVHCQYKRGVRNGLYRAYYLDGPLYSKGKYLNGKQVGKWIGYQESGAVSWWEVFDKNGEVLSICIYNLAW